MIVCDTSGLYAAYNSTQPEHREVMAAIDSEPGPLVVTPYVLTELDYLLRTKTSISAEIGMLRDVDDDAYQVEQLDDSEWETAVGVLGRYRNRNLGLADAATVVIAARLRTTNVLTLDERDFRAVKPLWGQAFRLLPADR